MYPAVSRKESLLSNTMANSVVIHNRALALDKDGYLANLDDWSEQVAEELARQMDISLTSAHWEILWLIRDFHQ
ncbi:MAG: Sulfurtransferase TusE, partial [Pseudomonadota bacterium]